MNRDEYIVVVMGLMAMLLLILGALASILDAAKRIENALTRLHPERLESEATR